MALLSSTQSSQGQMSLLGQGTSSHQRASHEQTQLKTLALIDQLQSGRAQPVEIPSSVKTAISQQGLSLSSALATIDPSLSKQLQNTLPGGCYPRLLALSTQTHESQFLKGVYELALHLQGSHHKPEALALVQWLQFQDLSKHPSLETQISELFTVLSGGGTLAQQAKSIVSEASSAEFLAPMVVGQLSFGLTRIGLAQTVMRNWGRGAKLIGSGLSAFAVEGASFSLAGQQVALAQGRLPQGLAESLPHAYWTMSWLRGTGMAASSLLTSRLGVGLLSRLGSRAPIGQKLISKAAEGAGIHLSTTQAYRVNLGPEHVENPWSQTGRTLLTFTLGGAILHAGFPAYARATQSLHQETAHVLNNSASRGLHRLQQSLRLHAQPELALAAAGPVGEFGPNLSPQEAAGLMSFRLRDHIPGLGRKNGDHTSATSPAHQGSSSSKSLGKMAKSLGLKGLEKGLTGYIQLASGQRLNAWHQPGRPFPKKVQAKTSPALPRSRAELILRSRAAGMGRDALARIRRDLARLEGLPEIQLDYLQLATRIETGTQEQLATPVDQLLAQWPMLESLERAEAAAKAYVEALAKSELGGHKSFQEAHLIEARVAKLRTLRDYEKLDEATLARWNVNPLGLHAAGRHAERLVHDPLLRRNLETVLTDPLMKSNSRVTRFRAALTEFEEKFSKFQADFIRDDVPRLKEIEAEIAANKRDIKRRRELEEERSTINSKNKVPYDRAAENLNRAMRDFLRDPATARFYVVQMRRLQLQDLAITRAPASWFRSQLTEENIEALSSEKARQAAQELLNTEAQLALARERGPLARFGHGLAYFVRLSSESPSTLLQRNLQARFTLRDAVHRDFWDFSQAEENLTDLLSAQEAWRGACYEAHQTARAAYRSGSLTETLTELWGAYDKLDKDWNHVDLERQGRQVRKTLPGELAEIEEVNKAARVAVTDFLSSVAMQESPVDRNRKLEVAQSALAKLRGVAGKSIKTQILGVSLMSQPYATRKDTGSKFNWKASKPMIRRAAWRVPQFISAIRHGEAEAAHWRFADYGIRSFLDTGSRMVRSHDGQNPQPVSYIEMLDPLFIDIHHDAWRQFFLEYPQGEQQFSLDTIIEDQASTLSRETSNPQGAQIEARKWMTALYEVLFGGPVEHVPNIVAKPGLSLLVHPLFAQAIDTFASSSGNMAMERDIANTRGQIGVAFGDIRKIGDTVKTRRGPGSQIRYGQGTMGVSEMSVLGLMGLDGLNASVYSPMGVGRSLVDADGLAAWGEFSNLVSRMGRGAYLTAGKPDDSFGMPTMSGPSVVSSRFHLGTAFIDPRFGPDSTAANLLRTTYLLHTLIPENRPHIPEAAKALDPYRKPVSLEMERQIAKAFGEAEFYPTREKLASLIEERDQLVREIVYSEDPLNAEHKPNRARIETLEKVIEQETEEIVVRELQIYSLEMQQALEANPPHAKALTDVKRALDKKIARVQDISQRLAQGQKVKKSEAKYRSKFLLRAGAAVAGRTYTQGRDPLVEQAKIIVEAQREGTTVAAKYTEAKAAYHDYIDAWPARHQTAGSPESQVTHITEDTGYQHAHGRLISAQEALLAIEGNTYTAAEALLPATERDAIRNRYRDLLSSSQEAAQDKAIGKQVSKDRDEIIRRMNLLNAIELGVHQSPHRKLNKAQGKFLASSSSDLGAHPEIYGTDPVIKHLSYLSETLAQGETLPDRFAEAKAGLEGLVTTWQTQHSEGGSAAAQQIHFSEAEGFYEVRDALLSAEETLLHYHGLTPQVADKIVTPYQQEGITQQLQDWSQALHDLEHSPYSLIQPQEREGLRRFQRIVAARQRTLLSIQAKIDSNSNEPLTKTEAAFLQKARQSNPAFKDLYGRDAFGSQMQFLLNNPFIVGPSEEMGSGHTIASAMLAAQDDFYGFIDNWNQRRADPGNPEHQLLHPSQSKEFAKLRSDYHAAVELAYHMRGYSSTWKYRRIYKFNEGQLFPDVYYRQDGEDILIEPLNWSHDPQYSLSDLWGYYFQDTLGAVSLTKNRRSLDPGSTLYTTLHSDVWGHRTIARSQNRLRMQGLMNTRSLAARPSIQAPTHTSGFEFSTGPAMARDLGVRAFFAAKEGFFTKFMVPTGKKVLGIPIYLPKPPFGLFRGLLGDMADHGHIAIKRTNREAARSTMQQIGVAIRNGEKSVITFPGGTRDLPQRGANDDRNEGFIYSARPGVAEAFQAAQDPENPQTPILVIGLNGGTIYPKESGTVLFNEGAGTGREYVVNFGTPIEYTEMTEGISEEEIPNLLPGRVVGELNRQYRDLTGRHVDLPAPSKAKKKKGGDKGKKKPENQLAAQ